MVEGVLPAEPLALVELAVVVGDEVADDARLDVDLVDVAGVHVEGADEPRGDRLEHLVHVDALREVEAGVAHQLEVAAARVELADQAHVVGGGADVAGEALRELDLLAAVLARLLRPVEDERADLALERAHGHDEHALELHVRRERRQRRRVGRGEVADQGAVGLHRLGQQRQVRVPRGHLPRVEAEAEAGATHPVAVFQEQQDPVGGVQLLAQPLERELEELVQVVPRAAAPEDVRARLRELGAEHRVLGGRRAAA